MCGQNITLCTFDDAENFILFFLRHLEAVHAVMKDHNQFIPFFICYPKMHMGIFHGASRIFLRSSHHHAGQRRGVEFVCGFRISFVGLFDPRISPEHRVHVTPLDHIVYQSRDVVDSAKTLIK